MIHKTEGISFILGVASAIVVALVVLAALPLLQGTRTGLPLVPLRAHYVRVNQHGPYVLTGESISSVLQTNVTVTALSLWNESGHVMLSVIGIVVENGLTGELISPVPPYDFLVSPAFATLEPNTSTAFNLTLIPWTNASAIYGPHPSASFVFDVRCYAYTFEGTSDRHLGLLGAQFMEVAIGKGTLTVLRF